MSLPLCVARSSGIDVSKHHRTKKKKQNKTKEGPLTTYTELQTRRGKGREEKRSLPQEMPPQPLDSLLRRCRQSCTSGLFTTATVMRSASVPVYPDCGQEEVHPRRRANLDGTATVFESTTTPSTPNHLHFSAKASCCVRQTPATERKVRPATPTRSSSG